MKTKQRYFANKINRAYFLTFLVIAFLLGMPISYCSTEEFNYLPNDPAFQRYNQKVRSDAKHQECLFVLEKPQAWAIERGRNEIVVAIIDWAFDVSHPRVSTEGL